MLKGHIIKNISNTYSVLVDNKIYECQPRGKFRNLGLTPLVGDLVEFDEKNNYLLNILPRKNELDRPHISNIDIALIVTSTKSPNLSLNLLDKQISSIILCNISPVICFTKLDLLNKKELANINELKSYYNRIGIPTYTNTELTALKKVLKKKYIVLTGQTGAGKSSLINKLDKNLNIKTGEISVALGRGRHTTRHTEFFQIDDFFIADTPGFSSLDLKKYSKEEIRDSFYEFNDVNCKYRDCMHINDDGCLIQDLVKNQKILSSRYENYLNFIERK